MFPVETHYLSPQRAASASRRPHEKLQDLVPVLVREALHIHPTGDVLVFLPGLADQRRVAAKLASLPDYIDLHTLHGELPAEQQDAALRPAPAGRRKVVLATSIAETSLTIEGVSIVVDGGYARIPRFEPRSGLTTLGTEPASQAAADQRRGRAGRLGPGTCYRLWTEAEFRELPPHLPPEILTADLSPLALELALVGRVRGRQSALARCAAGSGPGPGPRAAGAVGGPATHRAAHRPRPRPGPAGAGPAPGPSGSPGARNRPRGHGLCPGRPAHRA